MYMYLWKITKLLTIEEITYHLIYTTFILYRILQWLKKIVKYFVKLQLVFKVSEDICVCHQHPARFWRIGTVPYLRTVGTVTASDASNYLPGNGAALNVRAPDHVDEVDMAVAGTQLDVSPRPLRPVVRVLILAERHNIYLFLSVLCLE